MQQYQPLYTQVGVPLSMYAGKTRSYLLHKRIPFTERGTNAWEFFYRFRRRNNAAAIPVVITPQGEWLQDTTVIIDTLEQRFPDSPVLPATPVLRLAAYLFELWGDEFWLPLAMHTRWSHPENVPFFVAEAGDGLLPGFPRWLKTLLGTKHAGLMRSHAANAGVTPEMAPVLDRFLQIQLDALDAHFTRHRFLLGDRPSLGDYGMIAPLYAHIGRDPWSRRELIEPRVHLKSWIERMFLPDSSTGGEFWPDDELPATLLPALRSIFDEMLPFLAACGAELRKTPLLSPDTRTAPRFLGRISYPMAGGTHTRPAPAYPVWMAQRLLEVFAAMTEADRQRVRGWLAETGGEALLSLDLPGVVRVGLSAAHVG
jgi:glutathione S-transferase